MLFPVKRFAAYFLTALPAEEIALGVLVDVAAASGSLFRFLGAKNARP